MHFKKFKIVNVGPFESFEVDLTRGSIGIFGDNGRGKSTLLNLMYALLSNDFGRFAGVKADAIRNTVTTRDESYIYGEIEHAGKTVQIRRSLRFKPSTSVTCDDERETNADKAQEMINRLLGADQRLLNLYVFKGQDAIYDFLVSSPAERARAYQVLCRTENCETLWTMLGKFLADDRDVNAQIVDNSDELAADIVQLDSEIVTFEERRRTAEELQCSVKFLGTYEKRLERARRRDIAQQQQNETVNAEAKAKEALDAAKQQHSAESETLTSLQAKHDERVGAVAKVRADIENWKRYAAYKKRTDELERERLAITAELRTRSVPVPPTNVAKLQEFQVELSQAELTLTDARKKLDAFDSSGLTECPTCGTAVAHIQAHLAELRELTNSLPKRIKQLRGEISVITEYNEAERAHAKWFAAIQTRQTRNSAATDELTVVGAPATSEASLRAWLEKWETLTAQLQTAQRAVVNANAEVIRCRERRRVLQEQKQQNQEEIEKLTVEPEKLAKAQKRLAEHAEATTQIAVIDSEIRGLKRLKADKTNAIKALKQKLQRTRKLKKMARIIQRTRDVLHRDCLPQRVAQSNLARMEGDINDNLSFFADPFWVETDESLSVHRAQTGGTTAER